MADETDLFGVDEGAPSGGFADKVREAGERAGIKGPGRPKGATNRKTVDFEKWYFAKGFKDPAQALGELVSMDPIALHQMMLEQAAAQRLPPKAYPTLKDAIDLVRVAAAELMPYLHGKKPTVIDVPDERLPMLLMMLATNQLDQAKVIEAQNRLSIGAPLEVEKAQNSGLSEGEE